MSILIAVTEETNRQGVNNPPIPKLYGAPSISLVRDNGTSATIILDGKKLNEERIVSESYSVITDLVATGYTDSMISLTQTNGELVTLKASGIVEAYDNSDGKGVVIYRDNEKTEDIPYIVEETISDISSLVPSSYKSYIVRLSQTGTNNPVATVVVDELGYSAFSWARFATGFYGLVPIPSLVASKTAVYVGLNVFNLTGSVEMVEAYESFGFIAVETSTIDSTAIGTPTTTTNADDVLQVIAPTLIEIRVYD
jgi:hypothetical protein